MSLSLLIALNHRHLTARTDQRDSRRVVIALR
jgi:hypothetical protein